MKGIIGNHRVESGGWSGWNFSLPTDDGALFVPSVTVEFPALCVCVSIAPLFA